MKVVAITLNPSLDKTVTLDTITIGGLNRVTDIIEDASGKGINVSKNCSLWGLESLALGFLGGYVGEHVKLTLDSENIKTDMVNIDGNTRVNLKVHSTIDHVITEINEPGPSINNADIEALNIKIRQHVDQHTIMVLSGSAPRNFQAELYQHIVALGKKQGAWVVLDADKDAFAYGLQATPNLIKPNDKEVQWYQRSEHPLNERQLIHQAVKWVDDGIEWVVISRGKEGAIFADREHVYVADGLKVNFASSTGAGDAMVSAMIYAKANTWSFEKACIFAVAASAATVETFGTKPATLDAIYSKFGDVKIKEVKRDEN